MTRHRFLPLITAVFVTSLIISNIIAVKLISLGPLFFPAALIIFPISYIFGDILTEVYGYGRARRVIWIGFGCNLLAVGAIGLSILLPPAPLWKIEGFASPEDSQRAYQAILGFTPRLLFASFVAYLIGEFLNSFVLAKMKIATKGRHLWLRTIGSTLIGQAADSGIFLLLSFYGTLPIFALGKMILYQWGMKTAYEAAVTPLTYLGVNYLKRAEQENYFDDQTQFNPFRWRE